MVCIIVLSYKAVLKGRPGGELPALFESLYQLKKQPHSSSWRWLTSSRCGVEQDSGPPGNVDKWIAWTGNCSLLANELSGMDVEKQVAKEGDQII
jgi:hypothetical protein